MGGTLYLEDIWRSKAGTQEIRVHQEITALAVRGAPSAEIIVANRVANRGRTTNISS
jgi:hypothetical protein